ncbi:myb-like protein X [Ischnura elegans]|uniref:myb-like protein X n=1 Tax=Ischnura elegans TaxID=197161 RepID=UPI001ED8992C|nr:myb-like protein X [Ischnura elegans]
MNHGRIQLAEGELKEPKKKKVRPGTLLRDPYPIIFWNKLGIPPCKELWPRYLGVFDGDSVIVEDPRDMHEISTMGYFGKRLMCRRGYEQSIGDVPVVRERQWKRRVEWAAECGYILVPPDKASVSGCSDQNVEMEPTESLPGTSNVEVPESSKAGEKDGVLTNGDGAASCVDIPSGEDQRKKEKCEEQVAVTLENVIPAGKEGVSVVCGGDSSPSGAGESVDERGDRLKESTELSGKDSGGVKGDKEQVAVPEKESEAGDHMEVSKGEEKKAKSGKLFEEREGNARIKSSGMEGKAKVEYSTEGPVKVEDEAMDGSGEGGDSSTVTTRRKKDLKKDEEMRIEAEESVMAVVSTDVTMSEDDQTVDGSGEGGDSSTDMPRRKKNLKMDEEMRNEVEESSTAVVSTALPVSAEDRAMEESEGSDTARMKEDLKQDEEGRDETKESNENSQLDTKKVDDTLAGKADIVSKGKSPRGYQGTRRSPRSSRSSASKSKENEIAGGDSLSSESSMSPAEVVTRGRARRSLRKSFAAGGTGDELSGKGDSSMDTDSNITKPEGEGPAEITESTGGEDAMKGEEKKQLEADVVKESRDCDSEAVDEKADGNITVDSKNGQDRSNASEKSNESLDSGKDEACMEPKDTKQMDTTEDEGQRTPRRSSRRGRGSKRNRSPSVEASPLEGNVGEVGGENSKEGTREESTTVKRSKLTSEVPEEEEKLPEPQKGEVVLEQSAEVVQSKTCKDSMETICVAVPELGKDDAEKEVSDSGEKKGADKQCSVEEKREGTNLMKGSSDCEIVEIEDESSTQNSIVVGDDSVVVSTPCKSSEDPKELDASIATKTDSDDDIMEVSVEDEEVQEVGRDGQMIVNRRRSGSTFAGDANKNVRDVAEAERLKFQRMLREIRIYLPKDIEVTEVNLKNLREEEAGATKKPEEATIVDNDDDDVIEINLQKSDRMELEEGCEEEQTMDEIESARDEQNSCIQRRMRKEGCGFHRKERDGLGDLSRAKQEAEVESVATGNQGSVCEVAPCIVIPDSDSEAEEAQESPRLESDPSVFLPSLDVLQLIPEEAFFLAYGLGCLVVWDVRNIDFDPNGNDDERGAGSGDDSDLHPSAARENGIAENRVGGESPSSGGLDNVDCKKNTGSPSKSVGDRLSDSVNGCDSKLQPDLSNEDSVSSSSVKAKDVESPVVPPSKADAVDENKPSINETDTLSSPKVSSMEEVALNEASNGTPNVEDECADVGKKSEESVEKIKAEEGSVIDVTDKSGKVDVKPPCPEGEGNLESSENARDKGEEKKRDISCDSQNDIRDLHDSPKENGGLDDSSITVIDLADSPPSRGWARKSWPSQDDEVIVTMDTDVNDVSLVDPEPSVPENPSERTLPIECHRPMSILELWNAFRSCRASVSSSIPFETTYAVYHHFRSKRWVVKPGIRFGGDFLLYKDGPPFYHASYLVVIDSFGPDGESKFDWKTLCGMNRLVENIAKDLLLCRVEWPPTVTEKDLQSPECIMGLVVQEVLVRRWLSLKERVSEDPMEEEDDRESFIPLKVNP